MKESLRLDFLFALAALLAAGACANAPPPPPALPPITIAAPAERKTIDVSLSRDARFIGALAAFRDRNAQSRTLVPAPRGSLNVTIERARIVVAAVED